MTEIVNKSIIIIAMMFTISELSDALEERKGEKLLKCPKALTNPNSASETIRRSPIDCVRMCSQRSECSGVNICKEQSGQFTCAMTEDPHQGECTGLTTASQPSCYYAQRKNTQATTTTLEPITTLWCRNGGTLNGTKCDCPRQYAGIACERYVRDCSEVWDNGMQDRTSEVLFIQPTGAPAPFEVRCEYKWGGTSSLIRQSSISNFNQDFATLKAGIGNDAAVDNYFVGLDNLHYFTRQAAYELNFNIYGANKIYDNFTVGTESSSYAITYERFKSGSQLYDGFAASPPLKFSADGHDPDGCYAAKGIAGWYGAGCTGYPTFTNGSFDWPDGNGGTAPVSLVIARFVRKSAYYED